MWRVKSARTQYAHRICAVFTHQEKLWSIVPRTRQQKYFMFSLARIISKMQHIFIKEMWIYVLWAHVPFQTLDAHKSTWLETSDGIDATKNYNFFVVFCVVLAKLKTQRAQTTTATAKAITERTEQSHQQQKKSWKENYIYLIQRFVLKGACALIMSSTNIYYYKCERCLPCGGTIEDKTVTELYCNSSGNSS